MHAPNICNITVKCKSFEVPLCNPSRLQRPADCGCTEQPSRCDCVAAWMWAGCSSMLLSVKPWLKNSLVFLIAAMIIIKRCFLSLSAVPGELRFLRREDARCADVSNLKAASINNYRIIFQTWKKKGNNAPPNSFYAPCAEPDTGLQ